MGIPIPGKTGDIQTGPPSLDTHELACSRVRLPRNRLYMYTHTTPHYFCNPHAQNTPLLVCTRQSLKTMKTESRKSIQWRHDGCDGVSNYQRLDCLLNRLFGFRSKKTSKICVTGFCEGNSPVTSEFLSQRASNVENVSIWWRHHDSPNRTCQHGGQIIIAGCLRHSFCNLLSEYQAIIWTNAGILLTLTNTEVSVSIVTFGTFAVIITLGVMTRGQLMAVMVSLTFIDVWNTHQRLLLLTWVSFKNPG